jgi:hypothetical protein
VYAASAAALGDAAAFLQGRLTRLRFDRIESQLANFWCER